MDASIGAGRVQPAERGDLDGFGEPESPFATCISEILSFEVLGDSREEGVVGKFKRRREAERPDRNGTPCKVGP